MSLILSGTNGVSDVDGSAATPAIRGSDTNTGIFFPAADTIAFAEGGTESGRFDSAGNLLLNTTTQIDSGRVSVSAGGQPAVAASGANFTGYSLRATGTSGRQYVISTTDNANGLGGGLLAFFDQTANALRACIDSSGNFMVGTTSPLGGITSNAGIWRINGQAPDQSAGFLRHVAGGTTTWQAFGNGNSSNLNNSWGGISDAKLKENIVDATPKLEKLQQVRVVNYNLIGGTQKQIGVIAQELEQVFPGMVDETPDLDAEGNDLGTTTKSVKYSVFVPMLIKAIQEQQAIITALTARVAALEGQA